MNPEPRDRKLYFYKKKPNENYWYLNNYTSNYYLNEKKLSFHMIIIYMVYITAK